MEARTWRKPHQGQSLGQYIREARTGQGLSQDELVRRTGLSLSALRKIEDGRTESPGLFTLRTIWEALNLPVEAYESVSPGGADYP